MEKIYKTTGKISFYKMPQINPLSFQKEIIRKAAVQFEIDGIFLSVFIECKGNCIKIPRIIKIIPDHSDLVSFIHCGILYPNKEREEYDINVEYSVKVILDILENMREFSSITEKQKNILVKKL